MLEPGWNTKEYQSWFLSQKGSSPVVQAGLMHPNTEYKHGHVGISIPEDSQARTFEDIRVTRAVREVGFGPEDTWFNPDKPFTCGTHYIWRDVQHLKPREELGRKAPRLLLPGRKCLFFLKLGFIALTRVVCVLPLAGYTK